MRFAGDDRQIGEPRVGLRVGGFQYFGPIERKAAKPTVARNAINDEAVPCLKPLLIVMDQGQERDRRIECVGCSSDETIKYGFGSGT
ncbi:hypothetical protein ASE88_03915 [Sphingomonas sp. Leaf38]|nr:hypothetical protein ASE88_03915 [Sphingomonas sp. Leaf38]